MSEKLKTKSELMREMQEYCDYVNEEIYEHDQMLTVRDIGHNILCFTVNDIPRVGKIRRYRPDPVPPKENELVWVRHLVHGYTVVLLSSGELNKIGILCKDSEHDIIGNVWSDWCSVKDENNHSEGWDHSWIPRVKE